MLYLLCEYDGSVWRIMHELVNAVFLGQSLFETTMI